MADNSEQNNPPQFEREISNNNNQPPQAVPIPIEDWDHSDIDDDDDDILTEFEEVLVEVEGLEDSDSEEEDDDDDDEEEEEEEYLNPAVMLPRVPANSVEAVGDPNGCGEGGKVAAAEGEVDGLICPICMGPWTSGGDHQVCCLRCGHLYGLSCIRRWIEHREGSAKCPQCNQKCKPKDVRVLYASRVVVADEESIEKIQFLEAKCALLEEAITERSNLEDEMTQQQAAELRRLVEQRYEELTQRFTEMKCIENQRFDDRCRQFEQEQLQQQAQFMQQQQAQFIQQQQQLQQQHAQFMQQWQLQQQQKQQQQQQASSSRL